MSRQKVYYTINEIIPNLTTIGQEWMLESLEEYKGSYHKYTTGEVYTEAKYNPNKSKKLIPYLKQTTVSKTISIYSSLKPNIKTKYDSIQSFTPKITTEILKQGFLTRYFIQQINSAIVTEISEDQFNDFQSKKIDPNLYATISLKWVIKGPINDVTQGSITTESVPSQNKKSVSAAQLTMPQISNILNNYLELYVGDNSVENAILETAPKDINNLDS